MPASELLNRSVPLCEVWGSAESARFARIADETTVSAQIKAMEAALIRRMANAGPVDRATRAAIRWMAQRPNARVEQLSEWLGMSSRQLRRRFVISAGYGPKMFQCVLRFQLLLNEAHRTGARRTLADLAANAGYSDQAHMTREIQRFANRSPVSVLRSVSSTLSMVRFVQDRGIRHELSLVPWIGGTCWPDWLHWGSGGSREAGRGDTMEQIGATGVLFIAGFGPIVGDTEASRKLYAEALGIPFKEETGGYFIPAT